MKIYNIRKSKDFFNRLSGCEGEVEIISEDGKAVKFTGSKERFWESELSCFDGTIPQIEVKFQKTEDLNRIISFVMNERRTA